MRPHHDRHGLHLHLRGARLHRLDAESEPGGCACLWVLGGEYLRHFLDDDRAGDGGGGRVAGVAEYVEFVLVEHGVAVFLFGGGDVEVEEDGVERGEGGEAVSVSADLCGGVLYCGGTVFDGVEEGEGRGVVEGEGEAWLRGVGIEGCVWSNAVYM